MDKQSGNKFSCDCKNVQIEQDKLPSSCTYKNITGFGRFQVIMSLLGLSLIIDAVVLIIYFIGEQLHIIPVINLIILPSLSLGDNVILFIVFIIGSSFIGVLLLWFIYRYYHKKQCKKERTTFSDFVV